MGFKKNFNKNKKTDCGKKWPKKPFNKFPKSSRQDEKPIPKMQLREDQAGILEYVNEGPGFTGIFKSRFSDFHVNEIDLNGQVLHLTSLDVPQEIIKELDDETVNKFKSEVADVVPEDLWENLEQLSKDTSPDAAPFEFIVNDINKESRTKIHHVIKQIYRTTLVSTTVNEPDTETKKIRVLKRKGLKKNPDRMEWNFPGQYVNFLVYKENIDTVEVASTLASRLRIHPSNFTYSGTKDKRAKTTQKFCIRKRLPMVIANAAKDVKGIHIGNFEFSDNPLRLGDLKGNKFRIALRHIQEDEDVEHRLEKVKENGFINYYGLQRFGNCASIPTHEIGIAILKCDYKLACELILKPRDADVEFLRPVRKFWWEKRDSRAAAEMIQSNRFIEKQLLVGLAEYGEKDYSTALRRLPRNTMLLYIHAFQSYIFNCIASRRIKQFGLKLMVGDLVYKDPEIEVLEAAEDAAELLAEEGKESIEEKLEEVDEEEIQKIDDEPVEKKAKLEDPEEGKPSADYRYKSYKDRVKALTQEDIDSGKYSIFDVVLPLPGFDIAYPDNEVGQWYVKMLDERGLTSRKMRHPVKSFAMPGAYRKMVIKPRDMTWEFKSYSSPEDTLISSDWDELQGTAAKESDTTADAKGKAETKPYKALVLTVSLPSSAYATMLLRELLKVDTSASNQTQLEQMHMAQKKKTTDKPAVQDETESPVEDSDDLKGDNSDETPVEQEA